MSAPAHNNLAFIKGLTFLMFMMFGMTTESVGVIIPQAIKQFHLSAVQGGAFHYAPMTAIALAGVSLGFMADRFGRKTTILLGLVLFACDAFLFSVGNSFVVFLALLSVSGIAIGVFKTGALALIGDTSTSTTQHTTNMNLAEGFFGSGAIVGPLLVTLLLTHGAPWKWLYVIVGVVCVILIAVAVSIQYPPVKVTAVAAGEEANTLSMLGNPYALGFSAAIFLYVATECAIYVWMPTLLADYKGSATFFAAYALTIFFVLRAAGRFLASWLMQRVPWGTALAIFCACIFLCFLGAMLFGIGAAVYLLPLSGLFMSAVYPTVNSKGISCFRKAEHGAVAGVILFFTCAAAALGPLAMAWVSDASHSTRAGFVLATGFAALLALATLINAVFKPAAARLNRLNTSEYDLELPIAH